MLNKSILTRIKIVALNIVAHSFIYFLILDHDSISYSILYTIRSKKIQKYKDLDS